MGYCSIQTATMQGVDPVSVTVEVHLASGLPNFHIVGLGDTAVKESIWRVISALRTCGFAIPRGVITVNLAPARLRKAGTGFDLPIALGILVASGQVPEAVSEHRTVVGELGLDGQVTNARGMVGFGLFARTHHQTLMCADGSVFNGLMDLPIAEVKSLRDLLKDIKHYHTTKNAVGECVPVSKDFAEVVGQQQAVRALTIAAAGQHNILMIGPPGTGKTMLASRLPSILPPLSGDELLETSLVNSVGGIDSDVKRRQRPFRSPHHSATLAGIIGGGNPISPGEASFAHNGVLFLDEMTQFSNATLQSLRQPIEEGVIQIVRAADAVSYPSRVMVIGAANPCPCGYFGDTQKNCRCLPGQIEQYQKRIGGPIMDRFDVVITVARPETDRLFERGDGTSSAELARVVARAWEFACKRGAGPNRSLSREYLTSDCAIEADALATVKTGAKRLHLSGRGIVRCLRLARTIADMEQSPRIARSHLIEALSYRGGWFSDVS